MTELFATYPSLRDRVVLVTEVPAASAPRRSPSLPARAKVVFLDVADARRPR